MEKVAVVTGASSGIGLEISKRLCEKGYKVYGFGRNFEKEDKLEHELFHRVVCDITQSQKVCDILKKIQKENDITLLINNAGVGYYGLHEEQNIKKIQEMVRTNLEAPMIITSQLLRTLKKNKGTIINISSVTANKTNPHGCAYGATKAGISSFTESLFDEARKYGVKVAQIQPDMTSTNLYRNADFMEGEERESYLEPSDVASAVNYILEQENGVVISNISIKPQIHRIRRK